MYAHLFLSLSLISMVSSVHADASIAGGISTDSSSGYISPDKSKSLDDSERKAAPGDDTFNTEAPGGQNFETNVPAKVKPDPDK